MHLSEVIVVLVCCVGNHLNNVQGIKPTSFVQRIGDVLTPLNAAWNKYNTFNNSKQLSPDEMFQTKMLTENYHYDSDAREINGKASNRNVNILYKINENESIVYGAFENMSTMNESNENGSFVYELYQINSPAETRNDNEFARRVKRQFTSNVEAREEGMFSKMTSISYQRLQRCFEYWYENLFAKDRNMTKYTPTHPLHADSARKIGFFARRLVNGTYRRLDMEEPK